MKIRATTIGTYTVTLTSPFVTSLRSVYEYPVSTFAIVDHDGINGIGEAVATPAIVGDSAIEIDRELHSLSMLLIGKELSVDEISSLSRTGGYLPSTIAAIDLALLDYQAKSHNQNIQQYLGISQNFISTDVTIPICEINDLEKIVTERSHFKTFKIKLKDDSLERNLSQLIRIKELQPDASLRIDPNQAWDVPYSIRFLEKLDDKGILIDYLEQPIDRYDFAGLAEIKKNSKTPIMADESCFSMNDISTLLEYRACDYVNIKLMKSGGYSNALAMSRYAIENGLQVSIGSMMEGNQGIYVAGLLAAAISPFYTHDLDAAWWFTDSKFSYVNGELRYA